MRKIIIGNWKMNPLTLKEAEKLFGAVAKNISRIKNTEIVVCPPFLYLEKLRKFSRKIKLGAQDAFWGDAGAFTEKFQLKCFIILALNMLFWVTRKGEQCLSAKALASAEGKQMKLSTKKSNRHWLPGFGRYYAWERTPAMKIMAILTWSKPNW